MLDQRRGCSVISLRSFDGGHVSVLGLDPRAHPRELRQNIGSQLQESALPDRSNERRPSENVERGEDIDSCRAMLSELRFCRNP